MVSTSSPENRFNSLLLSLPLLFSGLNMRIMKHIPPLTTRRQFFCVLCYDTPKNNVLTSLIRKKIAVGIDCDGFREVLNIYVLESL